MPIVIDHNKCCRNKDGGCRKCDSGETCSDCIEVCPVQAISGEKVLRVDETRCIMCGACVAVCEREAITMN